MPADGVGAGDHDEAYWFGQRLTAGWHQPFTDPQFWRLMLLRSKVRDKQLVGDTGADPQDG